MRRILVLLVLFSAAPLAAQQDREPVGVQLGLQYTVPRRHVAVRPFASSPEVAEAARLIHGIVERDLDYSDRYQMVLVPEGLAVGPILYGPWNDLGVEFLVTGEVQRDGEGYVLRLALHDVVYNAVKNIQAFSLPPESSPDFRMSVHAVADEVVRWISNEPGMAASRIVAVRSSRGRYELVVVDSDGENLRTIFSTDKILYSPTWSPDGNRIAYAVGDDEGWNIHERNLRTGETRVLRVRAGAQLLTPAYSPDGRRIAFGLSMGGNPVIYDYDISQNCCLRRLTSGPGLDVSPTYSPDGRRIAFNSDRIGQPHIYTIPADGGEATLITPYTYGQPAYFTSPDWSPTDSMIAFHGRSRGRFQIMVVSSRPGSIVYQLTTEGENEDPSWAPDGRHLVFVSSRGGGGLYAIDARTGRERRIVGGGGFRLPDWSPTLKRATTLAADNP